MSYQYHTQLSSTFFGGIRTPRFIVIHWYGNPGQTGDVHGTAQYLAGTTHASVNYVTAEGHVYCLVSPDRIAWGQGDGAYGEGNNYGISIENNPWCTPGDRETTAELIANLRKQYGMLPLRLHKEFTSTACPGVWANQLAWLDARSRQIMGAGNALPTPNPNPAPVGGNTRVIGAEVGWVRTAPRKTAPPVAAYPNGIARGATILVEGFVKGDDPYDDGVVDDAWLKTKSGYIWCNGTVGNSLAGLKYLGDMSTKAAPATKPAPAPTPATVLHNRTVTNAVAYVRTEPRSNAPMVAGYPNGIAQGAVLAVKGYVSGQDPYGTGDDAWYVTKSGGYVWANAAQNTLAGLSKLN